MEMKERQRWTAEEDALLCAYVKQYGPREWSLVSQRMNTPLNRDSKSCLERWKNYLKPGIKKGSLTEEEQRLVIHLQAKHGNKWKKIAAEIPGRTAKRLGKWWEVFKEKQQKEKKENERTTNPIEDGKYDRILETFAEKLVKEQPTPPYLMSAPNGTTFLQTDQTISAPQILPPWLSNSNCTEPSVTLSLSSPTAPSITTPVSTSLHWMQPDRRVENILTSSELVECCKELEEGHKAWTAHKKESAWRLKRVELQLESEKSFRKNEKMNEIEAKVKALKEEMNVALERIEAEYKQQITGLRRDAELKEQKLVDQWASKHIRLRKFLEQMGFSTSLNCR